VGADDQDAECIIARDAFVRASGKVAARSMPRMEALVDAVVVMVLMLQAPRGGRGV
jgi:hypothetical protein